jgi:hypothetical protein
MKPRFALLYAVVALAMAADRPYAGKWKVNLARSDFGESTAIFESLPGGEWQSTAGGVTYKFKIDGREYPDGLGGTVVWKAVDANTWELVSKVNGRPVGTDTLSLAAGDRTLTDTARQKTATGGALETTTVYERVSGGPSLAGTWKAQKVSGASGTMEIMISGPREIRIKDAEMGMSCDVTLDGRDYPCSGPMLPAGFTVAAKDKSGSLHMTVKKDMKPVFRATYIVAPDGRLMTEESVAAHGGDKVKLVFDRM